MKFLTLLAITFSTAAIAKQITVNQALGFFYGKQVSHSTIIKICKSDHPDLKLKLESAFSTWEKSNERILKFANEVISEAQKEVPHVIEKMTKAGKEGVTNVYNVMPTETKKDYCNHNIEMLSGKEWNFKLVKPDYFEVVDRYLRIR